MRSLKVSGVIDALDHLYIVLSRVKCLSNKLHLNIAAIETNLPPFSWPEYPTSQSYFLLRYLSYLNLHLYFQMDN